MATLSIDVTVTSEEVSELVVEELNVAGAESKGIRDVFDDCPTSADSIGNPFDLPMLGN
jgi:hypothetical protein